MRLMGLLGERDGHSGIYTLHSHPRPMHVYPVRVYWFADGLAAVGGQVPPGAKLVAVGGVPIDDVVARVRPLITRDNEWSFRERVPYYVVCAEVLMGSASPGRSPSRRRRAGRRAGAGCGRPVRRRVPLLLAGTGAAAGAPRPLWVATGEPCRP